MLDTATLADHCVEVVSDVGQLFCSPTCEVGRSGLVANKERSSGRGGRGAGMRWVEWERCMCKREREIKREERGGERDRDRDMENEEGKLREKEREREREQETIYYACIDTKKNELFWHLALNNNKKINIKNCLFLLLYLITNRGVYNID